MIRQTIENTIRETLVGLGLQPGEIKLEHPDDFAYGDYSSNVAMLLGKEVKRHPAELAGEIVKAMPKIDGVREVKVAGPGFINFYLSNTYFKNTISEILRTKCERKGGVFAGQRTVVEYTDPNPFKEFHIGHLMSNTIGEAISRIVEANGAKVYRACYQGDVGLHVAKTIWGVQKMLVENPESKKLFFGNIFGFGKDVTIWGKAYSLGATNFEESEDVKKEVTAINKKIYEKSDENINDIYRVGRKVTLKAFEKIYKMLGTKFDEYFFESEMSELGKSIVEQGLNNEIFENSNGAIIYKGENDGLHTRVFVNSEGLPTYEAKELGLAKVKFDRTSYDKSIVVTGNEIVEYFKVLLSVMKKIYPDLAEKTLHMPHGMLRLPTGKMSSRTGKVVPAMSLISDIQKVVIEKIKDRDMTDSEKSEVVEKVSVSALKYSILRQMSGKDIIFDFEKSLSFEGDSGPYLQYSYARASSILKKADSEGVKGNISDDITVEAGELEKMLSRFGDIVKRAGEEYSPHYIATYLIQLCGIFNTYYAVNKIVDSNDPLSPYKISLTSAFRTILSRGLHMLGISTLERM